jgi:hypothetical protein
MCCIVVRAEIWRIAGSSRAQSSRLAEFGGLGMSFNICRGTLGTASSHQREQNFGYGDKADRERDSGDGELLADHGPTKWISRIEKRDPDLCLGRVGASLPLRAGPPGIAVR